MTSSRRPLKSRETRWARALAQALVARRISPNAISVAGMALAAVGALSFYGAAWLRPLALVGAAGVQLRLLCNMMDGLVAVEGGLKSRGGDLFNEAPDRFEDVVLLASAGWAAGSPTLGWTAAAAAVLTAYVRALGASLGHGQDFCGPLAKPQRMFFLTVGALGFVLWPPLLWWALWLIAGGAFFTSARRIVRLYAKMP